MNMKMKARRRVRSLFVTYLAIAAITLGTAQAQDATQTTPLPDSPSATAAQNAPAEPSPAATAPTQPQTAPAQAPAETNTPPARKPLGTAAAEKPSTTGIAASTAAGAAIAPGKQRRSRSLLLKVGAIIGAGVAVGTVAGLTMASPSRPPGSH
jgi:uncharacterized membrane protein